MQWAFWLSLVLPADKASLTWQDGSNKFEIKFNKML